MRPLALAVLIPGVAFAGSTVILENFPFVKQKPDFCGEADVEMALGHYGYKVSQDEVFAVSGVDPALGRGVWTKELKEALKALHVDPGPVWGSIDAGSSKQLDAHFDALVKDLSAGVPDIVCMHYDDSPDTTEHFRLITGYDAKTDEVVYQEPAVDHGENQRMKRSMFLKLWPFHYSKEKWTVIRFSVPKPSEEPVVKLPDGPSPAELSQHVQELKKSTLPKGFGVTYEAPFLLIGNASVRTHGQKFTRWFDALLEQDFLKAPPTQLNEVWLFEDNASYVKTSKEVFNTDPDTPYGYYLSSRNALVMNIGPGYGTLSHELVHPYMHRAWPDVPAWLNEGLASLFEFPAEKDGHITGKVNWRLPALQAGLKRSEVMSFHQLTHLSDNAFYQDDRGTNYAEARYLIYWLQERGLLRKFIKRALELKDEDGTGWKALTEVLGGDPDAQFKTWSKFTLGLNQHES
ncbi:MAG: C39 family peptidase [Myxococcaceae bacterium]